VSLIDVPLGDISGGLFTLASGATRTFEKTVRLTGPHTNTVTARAVPPTGPVCEATDSLTVNVATPPCAASSGALEVKEKEIKWKVENPGQTDLVIKKIDLTWPAGSGILDEIHDVHKGDFPPPLASITSGFESKALIEKGKTKEFQFKFKSNLVSGDVKIRVEFQTGCFVEISSSSPTTAAECKDIKPINELTMRWTGTTPIQVKAYKGGTSTQLLGTFPVAVGQDLTVTGYAGAPNDVIWEIFNAAGSSLLGRSTFHLSCSDQNMNGPEDCNQRQGDGKDLSGFINDWLFRGMSGSGQTISCTP
jgi:hypothetical protein